MMKFSEKVRRARIQAGYSQKELAEKTEIAERTIQNYESGERLPKQRKTYRKLAEALNIPEETLMDENVEFVLRASDIYGRTGSEEAQRLINEVTGLYAGGRLAEEDMDAMMQAFQKAYWIAKQKGRQAGR